MFGCDNLASRCDNFRSAGVWVYLFAFSAWLSVSFCAFFTIGCNFLVFVCDNPPRVGVWVYQFGVWVYQFAVWLSTPTTSRRLPSNALVVCATRRPPSGGLVGRRSKNARGAIMVYWWQTITHLLHLNYTCVTRFCHNFVTRLTHCCRIFSHWCQSTTRLPQCWSHFVTPLLHLCHTCVTGAKRQRICHTFVTRLLHFCHTFGTRLSHFCHTGAKRQHVCHTLVTLSIHFCHTGAKRQHVCHTFVTHL